MNFTEVAVIGGGPAGMSAAAAAAKAGAKVVVFDRIDLGTSLTIGVLPGFYYFVCRIVEGELILHVVIRGSDRFKHTIVRIM